MESLEVKAQKPDPRQWVPIFGIEQIEKDRTNGRPTINYYLGVIYHAGNTALALGVTSYVSLYTLGKILEYFSK